MRRFLSQQPWLAWLILAIGYFVSHLYALTLLPVFADEAIYIRWAQLIISDWQQYLFFPLNDGKTPLFIWLLVPFELLFKDPLWAGRFLMVILGFVQVIANGLIVSALGGKTRARWLAMTLTAILPFWYFYHRQALIDGLLTLMLSFVVLFVIKLVNTKAAGKTSWLALPSKVQLIYIVGLGVSFGLALLTKIPAILLLPALPWWVLLPDNRTWSQRFQHLVFLGAGLFIGLLMFALLRFAPSFGQLFSRGGDFLYPTAEILAGRWRDTLPNIPTYIGYFMTYMNVLALVLFVASLFLKPRKKYHLLFWSALIFCLPMAVMGKVVYARYFMPAAIFITASVALVFESVLERYLEGGKAIKSQMLVAVVMALMLANIIASSVTFMSTAVSNPSALPLSESDTVQYLTEWSSGHGIKEAEEFIREQAKTQKVAVATEGFFGTLPDGLFMYFVSQPDPNVFIEGIGQPVRGIPEFFTQRAEGYDKKYLVVNSHRLDMDLPPETKVLEICRPFEAPCLQVWDISNR